MIAASATGARHRTGGVLFRGDRDDAEAADAVDRRFDADEHVRVRGTEDRSGLVPTLAAHELAAVPTPELEPPTLITGRPSANGMPKYGPSILTGADAFTDGLVSALGVAR
jgi:hypothetical protein